MDAAMPAATPKFEAALQIVARLRAAGHEAYLAGGCVRDLLLGREPVDYDVATSATPDVVLNLFPRTFAVGARFGVVLVAEQLEEKLTRQEVLCQGTTRGPTQWVGRVPKPRQNKDRALAPAKPSSAVRHFAAACEGGEAGPAPPPPESSARSESVTEVATFRSDGAYSDGRHPDAVRYTASAEEDVRRRDFTINGLLLDPLRGPDVLVESVGDAKTLRSAVIDHVGGLADLDAGILRAIGRPEQRFEEDHLRMMRAVRFAARFNFELDPATAATIRALAPRISAVSRERVRDELTKMLTEGHARRAFELLDQTGLLAQLLPEVAKMHGVDQPPQFHPEGDVWIHTLLLLEQLHPGSSMTLAWAALLHDVGKPPTFRRAPDRIRFDGHVEVGATMAAAICRRFRFSNDETRRILALIENHMRFMDAQRMKASTLKRFFRLERFSEHLALHRMDCLAASGNLEHWEFVRERWQSMPEEAVRPKPLLTGRDLIAEGYHPGAEFKTMLRAVEDAQLEGAIQSPEDALRLVRERFPRP